MKESTRYLRSVIEDWQKWTKQHRRLTKAMVNTLEYVDYLEAENEALRSIISASAIFRSEIGKGDKK